MKKIALYLILLCCSFRLYAQDIPVEISEPIDISNFGWNKVLQMKNGNTLLFHFEIRKGMLIKVFDKNRKEISTQKYLPKVLDMNGINVAGYKGLYEIGGEAVLFISQDIMNHGTLLRLRFDANTGRAIAEDKALESPSFQHRNVGRVLKNPGEDEYYILSTYTTTTKENEIHLNLVKYSAKHEKLKELPLDIVAKDKKYDAVGLGHVNIDKSGAVLCLLQFSKMSSIPGVNDHMLMFVYTGKDDEKFLTREAELPTEVQTSNMYYTFNPFGQSFNIVLETNRVAGFTEGAQTMKLSYVQPLVLITSSDFSSANLVELKDTMANKYFTANGANAWKYKGDILHIYTNNRGLTTAICRDQKLYYRGEDFNDINEPGVMGITQYDDKGAEIWATVVPKAPHYYNAVKEICPVVFSRTSEDGLFQTDCFNTKSGFYIVYNDVNHNFDKTLKDRPKPIGDVYQTNAVCYHLNRKREISKAYLLGKPEDGVFRHACNNSSMLDEFTAMYATVFEQRKGKDLSMHIAWCKVED